MRKWARFSTFIYLVGVLAIAWLLTWPLIMNAWAGRTWQRVPCYLRDDGKSYSYKFGEITYISTRQNFWQLDFSQQTTREDAPVGPATASCYVNPSDPTQAVLLLDAHTNLSDSLGRIVAAALVAGVTIFVARTKSRKPPGSAAQTAAMNHGSANP